MRTALVHSEEWRRFDYGPEHPLRMERLGLTWRLMQAYGLTGLRHAKVLSPEPATLEAIATRLMLPADKVDLLIESGAEALRRSSQYQAFVRGL